MCGGDATKSERVEVRIRMDAARDVQLHLPGGQPAQRLAPNRLSYLSKKHRQAKVRLISGLILPRASSLIPL